MSEPLQRALAQLEAGETEAALEAFKAIEADPDASNPDKGAAAFFQGALEEDPARAEAAYLRSIDYAPDKAANVWFNLGTHRMKTGDLAGAAAAFESLLDLDQADWKARQNLVQIYQQAGQADACDAEIETLRAQHADGGINADYFIREKIDLDGFDGVVVAEYFELTGERAVRYKFHFIKNNAIVDVFSLGSYDATTNISREMGEIGPDERLFHLDRYPPDGSHQTFGFYRNEPGYDKVRTDVLAAIAGDTKKLSSSDGQGNIEIDPTADPTTDPTLPPAE